MIRRLTIRGWGPHENTTLDLDPKGPNTIVGPSMAGKSSLVDAACWCLWGTLADGRRHDPALIRDGADAAEVEVELGSGTVFRRKVTRAKTVVRQKNGETYTNAVAWNEALGPLGKHPELSRVTVAPLAWTVLADGEGGGRPLRDLIASVLPSVALRDVVRELHPELRDNDSLTESDVFDRRAEANRARDEAAGRLEAARGEFDRANTAPPTAPDLGLIEAWERWERAQAWEASLAALGERPASPHAGLRDVRKNLAAKLAGLRPTAAEDDSAERAALAHAEAHVAQLEAGGSCPTCGQALPDSGEALKAAKAAVKAAKAAATKAAEFKRRAESDRAERVRAVEEEIAAADAALAAPDPGAEWDLRRAALGPQVTATEPAAPKPASTRTEAIEAAGLARRHAEELTGARHRLALAEAAHTAAKADAERLDRLLDAVRKAPSEQARRIVEALGDLGPVTLRLPEEGRAIEVLVDGRPWWTASTGRLVVADLALRIALRRAQRQPWLALFVDDAQAWSGRLPEAGPSVVLRTADVSGLGVDRG